MGGLCGVPGRGTQDSGDGPGAACDGESRPESSTFSGEEDEKGEGLDVKPRLLEPRREGTVRGVVSVVHAQPSAPRPPVPGPLQCTPPLPVKSSWSKADSSGGPKRLLDSGSSEASGFSGQLGTTTGTGQSLAPEALPAPSIRFRPEQFLCLQGSVVTPALRAQPTHRSPAPLPSSQSPCASRNFDPCR